MRGDRGKQLFDTLHAEWKTVGASRSSTKRLRDWRDAKLDEFDTCAALVVAINTRGNAATSDELLAAGHRASDEGRPCGTRCTAGTDTGHEISRIPISAP